MHPAGPVKGAIALANSLVGEIETTLVSLKVGTSPDALIDPRVKYISLASNSKRIISRYKKYISLLKSAGGRSTVVSISICLSPDLLNWFCRKNAIICSSVRANNLINYKMIYGFIGLPLAIAHLVLLRRYDHVVVMSSSMGKQVGYYINKSPQIIGNFIEEKVLDKYRKVYNNNCHTIKIVFLGTLNERKQPILLINSVNELKTQGFDIVLDIIGDGPLRSSLDNLICTLNLKNSVKMHGHLSEPYHILARADVFVLPSLSEGISRAAIEALYLGVPAVLRNSDGNSELINNGVNGELFDLDEELPFKLISAAKINTAQIKRRKCLVPCLFRQAIAARDWINLIKI